MVLVILYLPCMPFFFFFSTKRVLPENYLIYTELSYQEKIKTIFAAMHTLKM